MLEDFRLKVFVTLSVEKNFTRAAEVLHISQPAVSQNISELEKQLGIKLFDRLRGEVVLTPAGEIFLQHANDIISKYEEISEVYMRFPDSRVRVAASDDIYNYLTEDILKNFLFSLFIHSKPPISLKNIIVLSFIMAHIDNSLTL